MGKNVKLPNMICYDIIWWEISKFSILALRSSISSFKVCKVRTLTNSSKDRIQNRHDYTFTKTMKAIGSPTSSKSQFLFEHGTIHSILYVYLNANNNNNTTGDWSFVDIASWSSTNQLNTHFVRISLFIIISKYSIHKGHLFFQWCPPIDL